MSTEAQRDTTRPASELSDRELLLALVEWLGYELWEMEVPDTFQPCLPPRLFQVVVRPGEGWTWGELPRRRLPWTEWDEDRAVEPEDMPDLLDSHQGAAALRAHIFGMGPHHVVRFAGALPKVMGASGLDPCNTVAGIILAFQAEPRQQAEAAYMAFLYHPGESK